MLLLVLSLACGKSDLPPPPTGDGGAATVDSDPTAGADDTQVTAGDDTDPANTDDTDPTGGTAERYHPDGYVDTSQHSMEAKLQIRDCTECHGADLTGEGDALSCDSCHTPHDPQAWRTDCTFCHGGDRDESGAPPEDIDDEAVAISFLPHTIHITGNIHPTWGCEQCHAIPDDPLTPGHFMVGDATPAAAELDFSGGLSADGVFGGAGTASCSNLYCHGNGYTELGSWSVAEGPPGCGDCHIHQGSGAEAFRVQSGKHESHVERHNLSCSECHPDTVGPDGASIADVTLHLNGAVDARLPDGMDYTAETRTCNGTCHSEVHSNRTWTDSP